MKKLIPIIIISLVAISFIGVATKKINIGWENSFKKVINIAKKEAPTTKRNTYEYTSIRKLSYGSDPLHKIDLVYPKREELSPIIIFVHGGGWGTGQRTSHVDKAEFFASQGYSFASIDYRLWPNVDYTQQATDVAFAVKKVIDNATLFGGDPSKVFIMGHSAGAHLTELVATDETYLASAGLSLDIFKGVILLDGAGLDMAATKTLNPKGWEELYTPIFGTNSDTLMDASPILHIDSNKGIAPHYLAYSLRREITTVTSQNILDALVASGIEATREGFDKDHEAMQKDIGKSQDPMNEPLLTFLEKYQ